MTWLTQCSPVLDVPYLGCIDSLDETINYVNIYEFMQRHYVVCIENDPVAVSIM